MDIQQVFALMDRFSASSITALELELEGARVKLEKGACAPSGSAPAVTLPAAATVEAPAAAPAAETGGSLIKAPLVGTFYVASAPDKAPFAPVGATVHKGQTVCVLEAMKMMSEVPAPCDCVIEEVLAKNGELAGYDAPLFRIREL